MTYLIVMMEIQLDRVVEVPTLLVGLLDEYLNVMPTDFLDVLPLKRLVEYHIELVSEAKTPAKAPYRMLPKELTKLKILVGEFLDSGKIQPSKASIGTPVVFWGKENGPLRLCVNY